MPFDFLKRKKPPEAAAATPPAASADAGDPVRGSDRGLAPGRPDARQRPHVGRPQQARADRDRRRHLGAGRRFVAARAGAGSEVDRSLRPRHRPGRRRLTARHDDDERTAHRVHKVSYEVALEVPPYRVVGTVYLYPGSEPDSLLKRSSEMFVPIVDASATMGDQLVGGDGVGHPGQPPVPARRRAGRRPDGRAASAAAGLARWAASNWSDRAR